MFPSGTVRTVANALPKTESMTFQVNQSVPAAARMAPTISGNQVICGGVRRWLTARGSLFRGLGIEQGGHGQVECSKEQQVVDVLGGGGHGPPAGGAVDGEPAFEYSVYAGSEEAGWNLG